MLFFFVRPFHVYVCVQDERMEVKPRCATIQHSERSVARQNQIWRSADSEMKQIVSSNVHKNSLYLSTTGLLFGGWICTAKCGATQLSTPPWGPKDKAIRNASEKIEVLSFFFVSRTECYLVHIWLLTSQSYASTHHHMFVDIVVDNLT